MQRQLRKKTEDIGAKFGVPSTFKVLRSATGVPKYKIVGSQRTCIYKTSDNYCLENGRWMVSEAQIGHWDG